MQITKKVGLIIANDLFRDEEYLDPKKILDDAGIKTVTIAKDLKICKGTLGATVKPDMLLADVNTKNFDAIIFVGGAGCKVYWHDTKAQEICREMVAANKILAAICSSVATPAFAGVLKNKKANSYINEREILKNNGAILQDTEIVVDGNIITANGPKAAIEFGQKILKALEK